MPNTQKDVFLLWHTNPDNEGDNKLIGVYSTHHNAQNAVLTLREKLGFKEHPECFEICPYRLDMTAWTEGFVTIE